MSQKKSKTTCLRILLMILAVIVVLPILTAVCDVLFLKNVEIMGYDHTDRGTVTLTPGESAKALLLYHLAPYAGPIKGEPCCDAYSITFSYRLGTTIYVGEGTTDCMIVRPTIFGISFPHFMVYYAKSPKLISYLQELIVQYGLPVDF